MSQPGPMASPDIIADLRTKLAEAEAEVERKEARRLELWDLLQNTEKIAEMRRQTIAQLRNDLRDPDRYVDYLGRLRSAGWAVAVHNDYREDGHPRTFWLLTNPALYGGRYIKGEGDTDAQALRLCIIQAEILKPSAETSDK